MTYGYFIAIILIAYFIINLIPFIYNYLSHYVITSRYYPGKGLTNFLKRVSLMENMLTSKQRVISGLIALFSSVFTICAFMAILSNGLS